MLNQSNLIESDIEAYLHQQEHKELSRFITCGSVDDGKSTLIGRLLHDTKTIFEDHLASLQADSKKIGTTGEKIDLSLLVDGLQSEREQGITIDVAYRYFSTEKRKFIIADTPGHEQYTRNMATGASTADLAIILIDARHGIETQTRRHSYIVRLLGIHNVIVAINKMDLVGFSKDTFEKINSEYREFASKLGIESVHAIPISALDGDNVVDKSEKTPWYANGTLLDILEIAPLLTPETEFRMIVQYVNRPNLDFRGFSGTIASGTIGVGDIITVLPSHKQAKVKEIVTFDGNLNTALASQAITLILDEEIDISRGNVIIKSGSVISESNMLKADIVWMDEINMTLFDKYIFKRGSSVLNATVKNINHIVDVNTQELIYSSELELNDIASVDFQLSDILAFDAYENNRDMGSFILIDKISNNTVAAGMIRQDLEKEKETNTVQGNFEVELNALIRRHFPHSIK